MRIGRSSLVVLGIIFAVLVAFSCADDDGGSDDTPTPTPSLTRGDFGGPYQLKKLADFKLYKDNDLSFSKVAKLDEDLLMESIEANDVPPYGDQEQRYNFAITSNGEIHVGVWKTDMDGIVGIQKTDICDAKTSSLPDDAFEAALGGGFMINFLPEDLLKRSPCSLTTGDGLLDALSKHFMLAQVVGTSIDKYDESNWLATKVAYAGQINVNVKDCTFTIDNDSGTYRPPLDQDITNNLALAFRESVGAVPTEAVKERGGSLNPTPQGQTMIVGCQRQQSGGGD